MTRRIISTIARSILPSRYHPGVYLRGLIRERTGMVVIRGCFAGLTFPRELEIGREGLWPMLLGTYEQELASVVEEIVRKGFTRIINAGAGAGYYAVGLARRLPDAVVYAFESDDVVRTYLKETTVANGVSGRVLIGGKCEPLILRNRIVHEERVLIVCDVEGYESELLDPHIVPELARAHVLVELHELRSPGITALLQARFEGSHQIVQIWQGPRSARRFPFHTIYTQLIPDRFIINTMNEWRSEQQSWFWMRPRFEGARPGL
jgi:hypothetical protein